MIARGFKPVGWVAAVATAALGCYMLSLNVASERAELASVEREIVLAKRDIRALQTELGTRGRLQQLEHWNADVLALSAPASGQFLNDELMLARYTEPQKSFEDRAKVQMASAEVVPTAPATRQPSIEPRLVPAPAPLDKPVLRQASLVVGQTAPFTAVDAAPAKAPVVKKPVPKAPLVKVAEAKPAAKPAAVKASAVKVAEAKPVAPKAAAKRTVPKVAEAKTAAPKPVAKAPAVKVSAAKPEAAKSAAKAPKVAEKAAKPAKAPAKSARLSDLAGEIAQASKSERSSGGAAGR